MADIKAKLAAGDHPVKLHRFAIDAYESKEATNMKYPGQGGFSSLQVAIIEQIVASKADVFFGTSTSTFTKEIMLERKLEGFDWTDGTSFCLLPEGANIPMCDYSTATGGKKCEAW